jgi:hypothetical protein
MLSWGEAIWGQIYQWMDQRMDEVSYRGTFTKIELLIDVRIELKKKKMGPIAAS